MSQGMHSVSSVLCCFHELENISEKIRDSISISIELLKSLFTSHKPSTRDFVSTLQGMIGIFSSLKWDIYLMIILVPVETKNLDVQSGTCTLREVVIVGSIIQKVSMPANHSRYVPLSSRWLNSNFFW